MAFNEKLNKLLEEIEKKKTFNYDIVFGYNNQFMKQNTLLHVKFKALSMEEKDVNLWWDAIQDIVQKDIGKVRKKYKWNERLYRHKISQTEKVMPSFEYKPLILFPKLKTLNEENDKGDTNGVGSSNIRIAKEPKDFRGRKDNSKREVAEQILEQVEIVTQEVSFHEYAFATTKIGE
jgi:hypothetical protein